MKLSKEAGRCPEALGGADIRINENRGGQQEYQVVSFGQNKVALFYDPTLGIPITDIDDEVAVVSTDSIVSILQKSSSNISSVDLDYPVQGVFHRASVYLVITECSVCILDSKCEVLKKKDFDIITDFNLRNSVLEVDQGFEGKMCKLSFNNSFTSFRVL